MNDWRRDERDTNYRERQVTGGGDAVIAGGGNSGVVGGAVGEIRSKREGVMIVLTVPMELRIST